ncbi:phosphatase PAP2 family protein [Thermodesulfovibrionales bacterium]|nr:phosphatase PAP2 family protein [Thermodesulfovibrionales bacterium]MCL0083902.1 phosphatase PAP2 family protein [Thermodesulfovibrionales bacterium]
MKKINILVLALLFFLIFPIPVTANNIVQNVIQDYKNFYDRETLGSLAISIGVAGVIANTPLDEEIQDWYQRSLRSRATDNFSEIKKIPGNRETIFIILGAAASNIIKDTVVGEWGNRTLRALLVGGPPTALLQVGLGAGRPKEDGSDWQPFEDNNAVSGHAFLGAIPFLTAAEMTYNPHWRVFLYLVSTLCGLSRINDDAHFLSQAMLGWWIAYLATTSVNKTETEKKLAVVPFAIPNGAELRLSFHF